MIIEVTAIVCGTIAFLWVFTLVVAGIVASRTKPLVTTQTLEEAYEQARSFLDNLDR